MSHALRADRLLIKPTAGARPASPCTPGRFIPKARNRGLTPDEPRATRTTTSLATAPDGPTKRHLQTPDSRYGRKWRAGLQEKCPSDGYTGTGVRVRL